MNLILIFFESLFTWQSIDTLLISLAFALFIGIYIGRFLQKRVWAVNKLNN